MGYLLEIKTRIIFVTASSVEEDGKRREIVIESRPEFAIVQLNGSRAKYPVPWEEVYEIAKARHVKNMKAEVECQTKSKRKRKRI